MDNEYKHNNHSIMEETGLPYSFLKRCNAELLILANYRQKKDKNKIYYNDNGLIVWREIRKLFEQQKTMAQIRDRLGFTFGTRETTHENIEQTNGTTPENTKPETSRGGDSNSSDNKIWIDALTAQADKVVEGWKIAVESKTQEVVTAQTKIEELQSMLLTLPDGRTPEQINTELLMKEEQRKELEKLNGLRLKRQELLIEYEKQTGWGKGSRREKIMNQIKELDT